MIIGTIESILADIASMLRRERLQRNLSRQTVADRSGLSLSAVKNLESGKDASLSTFIRVCRTLGKDEWILTLGPANAVSIADYAKRGNRPRLRAAKAKGRSACSATSRQ